MISLHLLKLRRPRCLPCVVAWSFNLVFWGLVAIALLAGCAAPPSAERYRDDLGVPVTYRYRGTSKAWCAQLRYVVGRQGWIVIDEDPRRVHLVLLEDLSPGCNPG